MKKGLLILLLLVSIAGIGQKTIRTLPQKSTASFNDTTLVNNGVTQALRLDKIYSLFFPGTTLQYTRGDGSLATFPTSNTAFTNGAGYLLPADITAKADKATTLTINGTTFDLSANRTWTIAGGGGSTTLNDNLTTSSAGAAALDAHQGLVLKGLVDGNTTAIAARVLIANYIVRETPAGLTNNSNTTFTLAHTPVSGKEEVYVNGIQQEPSSDYTISAATITMILAPRSTDKIRVTYIY